MRTSQNIAAAVVGVGLAGAAAATLPAFAAETTPGATPTSSATSTPDAPRTDHHQTSLDALVKNGTLTQAQADMVLAQLQADRPSRGEGRGDGPRDGRGGPGAGHGPGGPGGKGFGMRGGEMLSTAATTLGLSEDALRTQLQTKSLGQIADVQRVSRATLKSALTKAMTAQVGTRVDELIDRAPGQRPQRDGTSPTATPRTSATSGSAT